MINKYLIEFKKTILEESSSSLIMNDEKWLAKLYLFYQYLNADELMIDDLENFIINNSVIDGVIKPEYSGENHEFLVPYQSVDNSKTSFENCVNKMENFIINYYNGTSGIEYSTLRTILREEFVIGSDKLTIVILDINVRSAVNKNAIKDFVDNYKSKVSNVDYIVLFKEDIEEIISDVENPVYSVPKGRIKIHSTGIVKHGKEESALLSISAKSLKEIFINYNTKGLFSSNLRYYVKSAKVDSSIRETITIFPDDFWYFNNGIIITCSDYKIVDNYIELFDFSIVNGGQTTNLIGTTNFEKDFSIVCKVIKNKYTDEDKNIEFLSRVAETSNTQKPIRSKDIIANRIEQRKLRNQLDEVDVFLQIKRGEKINKKKYKAPWQNAKNDELGQIIFSFIFQHPGIARNGKSKMLENEKYYNDIYRNNYNVFLLLSFQHFKEGYKNWTKHVSKNEVDSTKIGLAKNSMFFMFSILGTLTKLYYNEELRTYSENEKNNLNYAEDETLRNNLSQNDIGHLPIFQEPSFLSQKRDSLRIFDHLYKFYLLPSYNEYKKQYPSSAYSNYTKIDKNFYRFVIPVIFNNFESSTLLLNALLIKNNDGIVKLKNVDSSLYLQSLDEELKNFRKTKYRESNGAIKAYEVFTNNQLIDIIHYKPQNIEDLKNQCKLKPHSIRVYGEEILNIVKNYIILE